MPFSAVVSCHCKSTLVLTIDVLLQAAAVASAFGQVCYYERALGELKARLNFYLMG